VPVVITDLNSVELLTYEIYGITLQISSQKNSALSKTYTGATNYSRIRAWDLRSWIYEISIPNYATRTFDKCLRYRAFSKKAPRSRRWRQSRKLQDRTPFRKIWIPKSQ